MIDNAPPNDDFADDQLVVWKKPDADFKDFRAWIEKLPVGDQSKFDVRPKYPRCDDSLFLLTGPGIKTYIQANGIDGTIISSPASPNTGDDGPVYYSLNFKVRHKRPAISPISSIDDL